MPSLQIQTGKHRGKAMKLVDGSLIIGRDEGADLRIASAEISRRHCRLTTNEGRVTVEDLGSSNGTLVNGQPIVEETELPPGGMLHVGPMAFRLLDPNQPPSNAGTQPARKGGRKVATAALKKRTRPDKPKQTASEDDALAWLTEDVPNPASGEEDTEVIRAKDLPPAPDDETISQSAVPPPGAASFASIADEAADIFRRHRLMQEQQANSSS